MASSGIERNLEKARSLLEGLQTRRSANAKARLLGDPGRGVLGEGSRLHPPEPDAPAELEPPTPIRVERSSPKPAPADRVATCQQGEPCGNPDDCPDPVGCGFVDPANSTGSPPLLEELPAPELEPSTHRTQLGMIRSLAIGDVPIEADGIEVIDDRKPSGRIHPHVLLRSARPGPATFSDFSDYARPRFRYP